MTSNLFPTFKTFPNYQNRNLNPKSVEMNLEESFTVLEESH